MTIKFRGLDSKTGNWVYGYFFKDTIDNSRIIIPRKDLHGCVFVALVNGTEGQFTGITDKHGIEVYQGDLRQIYDYVFEIQYYKGEFIGYNPEYGTIRSDELGFTEKVSTIHTRGSK